MPESEVNNVGNFHYFYCQMKKVTSGVARKYSWGSINKAKYLVGIFFLLKQIGTSIN